MFSLVLANRQPRPKILRAQRRVSQEGTAVVDHENLTHSPRLRPHFLNEDMPPSTS
jgi:hypothetical protein